MNLLAKYLETSKTESKRKHPRLNSSNEGFVDNISKMFKGKPNFDKLELAELLGYIEQNPATLKNTTIEPLISFYNLMPELSATKPFAFNEYKKTVGGLKEVVESFTRQVKLIEGYTGKFSRKGLSLEIADLIGNSKLKTIGDPLNKKLDIINNKSLNDVFGNSIKLTQKNDKLIGLNVVEYSGILISLTALLLIRKCRVGNIFFNFFTTIDRDKLEDIDRIDYDRTPISLDDIKYISEIKIEKPNFFSIGVKYIEEEMDKCEVKLLHKELSKLLNNFSTSDIQTLETNIKQYFKKGIVGDFNFMEEWFGDEMGNWLKNEGSKFFYTMSFIMEFALTNYYDNVEQYHKGGFGFYDLDSELKSLFVEILKK